MTPSCSSVGACAISWQAKQKTYRTYETVCGNSAGCLKCLQKTKPGARLKDFLAPVSFSELVSSVREVSGFSGETHRYETPSLAMKLSHSLKGCAEQALAQAIEFSRDPSQLRQFL